MDAVLDDEDDKAIMRYRSTWRAIHEGMEVDEVTMETIEGQRASNDSGASESGNGKDGRRGSCMCMLEGRKVEGLIYFY